MNLFSRSFRHLVAKIVTHLKHATASFYPLRGGGKSHTGKAVTVDVALTLSAVWACVSRLSGTISTMPIQIYERTDTYGGEKALGYDHPLYSILADQPNADMTAVDFWQAMQASLEFWGNAYAPKIMSGGQLTGLDFCRPDKMTVKRHSSGILIYTYNDKGSVEYTEDEILHIKGFTLDGILGLSPIAYMRHSLGLAMSLEESAGDVFKNGMRPSGIMEIPHQLNEAQRDQVYAKIDRFKQEKNGGVLVTEINEKFTPISINPEDAQLLASRNWAVEEICRWYGVPPYLVGYTEKSTSWGTGIEQQNIGYLTYSILPRLVKNEKSIARSLMSPEDARRYFVRFNVEGLLRTDSKTRADVEAIYVRNGVMNRNEVRGKENMAPYTGGDIYTIESNMTTVDRIQQATN